MGGNYLNSMRRNYVSFILRPHYNIFAYQGSNCIVRGLFGIHSGYACFVDNSPGGQEGDFHNFPNFFTLLNISLGVTLATVRVNHLFWSIFGISLHTSSRSTRWKESCQQGWQNYHFPQIVMHFHVQKKMISLQLLKLPLNIQISKEGTSQFAKFFHPWLSVFMMYGSDFDNNQSINVSFLPFCIHGCKMFHNGHCFPLLLLMENLRKREIGGLGRWTMSGPW